MDARRYVLITVLLGGMGQGVVAPKLPELLSGNAQLFLASGAAASLMYLGIFVSTQRFGRAADAGRAHLLVRWGLVAYALSLVALGCFRSTGAVFATRFVEGLALSAVYVAADFILGRLSKPRERAQWLSYYGVALSIGLALGPLAALALARVSPKPLFVLGAVAALALTLAAFAGRARVGRLPSSESTKLKLGLGPLSTGAVYGFMEAGLVAVFPVLAVRELGVRPELLLVAVIGAAAVSSLFWGWLADRVGARRVVALLLVALPAGCALLALSRAHLAPPHLGFAAAAFFGALAGGLYPVGFAWLLESVPESRYGAASGAFARAYGLGSLAGPLACAAAAQRFGSSGMFAAIAAAGCATLALGVVRRS